MCRGRGLGTVPWFAPVRPFSHRLAIWGRGGLRTPGKGASRSPTRITVRPPAHRHRTGWGRDASAFVWPYRPGAETAPLREKRFPHYPRAFPREAIPARITNPAEGRAPHARKKGHWLRGGYSPLGYRTLAHASGGNGMPWRSFSLAMRTHRVRPSEKSGFGTVPWFAPVRPSSHRLTIWRRGGLRTPAKEASRSPTRITFRPPDHRHRTGWERNASAFVWPYRPGAETAPLRGNRP
jgi:hypothetical protein